ncbi:hypothetical protein C5167_021846 [Papaver somniferum]|uniref:MORF/ORRM1/DAG-like MORF domain-containing protein n=1 Tax=Papaver somniferum TaxID=3469 RepID=A0A4Y7JHT3_PAPSO|nr:multiple organellar RNA editing factor 6, mitochondrial-like [Papaver somniferum]RZC60096.1 hypothetical protein C5167_021846 [Papaver somniferum]
MAAALRAMITEPCLANRVFSVPLPGLMRKHSVLSSHSTVLQKFTPCASGLNTIRWVNSGSNGPPKGMSQYIPGCDFQHWLVFVKEPGGHGATKEQMIECYVETLDEVLDR